MHGGKEPARGGAGAPMTSPGPVVDRAMVDTCPDASARRLVERQEAAYILRTRNRVALQ
jgi:hypothetical protein